MSPTTRLQAARARRVQRAQSTTEIRRATGRWLGMLGELLRDQPTRIREHGSRIVTQLQPADVSGIPNERLFVVVAFAGASTVLRCGASRACTFHVYSLAVADYRDWDPEGMTQVTTEGLDRAWDYLEDLMCN
ncbi:hypothetical protein BC629DRAFT_1598430 [Irpex lacteus]|nr:hypothetical protein BC629DRAFT_1598430 [Irpex lacteus]